MPLSSGVIEHRSFPGPSYGVEMLQESKEHWDAPNPMPDERSAVALATPSLTPGLGKRWSEATGSQKIGHGQRAPLDLSQN